MANFLLLGAGFSRNWGGWLASEAFEYLLGCPQVRRDAGLRDLLWRCQVAGGGFEDALSHVQSQHVLHPGPETQAALWNLDAAVSAMFDDMNQAFFDLESFEFQNHRAAQVSDFLTRFEAIFTLNQDVLLEQHYTNGNVQLAGRGWNGAYFPGMQRRPPLEPMHAQSWARSQWSPTAAPFALDPRSQPIFKLHGSSNWRRQDAAPLLVMGGAKTREIAANAILSWYFEKFEDALKQPGSSLMAIGYGFRDAHINQSIAAGVDAGLRMFVIAPEGAEMAQRLNATRSRGTIAVANPLEDVFQRSLIGASRRSLRETFGADIAEHRKVMRFFD